jgi:hypothetical protein
MLHSTRYLMALGCVVALCACNRDRDRMTDRDRTGTGTGTGTMTNDPGTTTVTGANVSLNHDAAVSSVVDARCTREAACNNIGADKRFGNREACVTKLKADMASDLNAADCPKGIDRKELDECLSEIRSESCNNPIEKIERLAACRTSDLCLKVDSRNR